ncbi:hypothetical protein YC2023_026833 [Brassica napus]
MTQSLGLDPYLSLSLFTSSLSLRHCKLPVEICHRLFYNSSLFTSSLLLDAFHAALNRDIEGSTSLPTNPGEREALFLFYLDSVIGQKSHEMKLHKSGSEMALINLEAHVLLLSGGFVVLMLQSKLFFSNQIGISP